MSGPARNAGDDLQLSLIEVGPEDHIAAPKRRPDLNLRDVTRWAGRQARTIARSRRLDPRGTDFLLAQTVKLGEEVGELYAEVLGSARMQRATKSEAFTSESMSGELADVLICTAIIAELMNIDLSTAVQSKMAVIDNRTLRAVESSKSG